MDGDGANKKRGTERQLTKDNYKEDDGHVDDNNTSHVDACSSVRCREMREMETLNERRKLN